MKTAEQMADDILISLRMKNAPERILIVAYLEKCLDMAKKEANQNVLSYVESRHKDINGDLINCNYHSLAKILNKK
jgi:hypothetical protein